MVCHHSTFNILELWKQIFKNISQYRLRYCKPMLTCMLEKKSQNSLKSRSIEYLLPCTHSSTSNIYNVLLVKRLYTWAQSKSLRSFFFERNNPLWINVYLQYISWDIFFLVSSLFVFLSEQSTVCCNSTSYYLDPDEIEVKNATDHIFIFF